MTKFTPIIARSYRCAAIVGSIVAWSMPASAVPQYVTFAGTVTSTFHFDLTNGSSSNGTVNGLNPGDSVSYTFAIDFSQPGQFTTEYPPMPGTTYTVADYGDVHSSEHYFLTSYVTGNVLPRTALDGEFNETETFGSSYFDYDVPYHSSYAFDSLSTADHATQAYPFRADYIEVFASCSSCSTDFFQLGQSFTGYNYRYSFDSVGSFDLQDSVASSLTLTSISDRPVPEPATLFLLGSGLASLGVRAVCGRAGARRATKSRPAASGAAP